MERRTLFEALVVASLLLVGMNQAIGWLGRDAVPRVIVRRIHSSAEWSHVMLGNSVVEAGFSPVQFERAASDLQVQTRALNAGLGWSTSAEHDVLWNEVLKAGNHPQIVLYGFFDLMLHEGPESPWWGIAGNSAMSYYVNPALSARYYAPNSLIGAGFMRAAAAVPLFTERSTFWSKIEKVRLWLAAKGKKSLARRGEPGAADSPQDAFRALEPESPAAFDRRCETAVRDEQPFSPAIRALIDRARESGVKLFLVEMPMPPEHVRSFYARPAWTAYKAALRNRLAAEGIGLIEAGDWVPEPSSFADSLHMNRSGAATFSRRLAQELCLSNEMKSSRD